VFLIRKGIAFQTQGTPDLILWLKRKGDDQAGNGLIWKSQ
jgi:hypothetical protein